MTDLSLTSTNDLIDELFKRNTFAGLLIYSPDQHKFQGQNHDHFILRTTTDIESSIDILCASIQTMKKNI